MGFDLTAQRIVKGQQNHGQNPRSQNNMRYQNRQVKGPDWIGLRELGFDPEGMKQNIG